jgi:DinB superfamily
MPQLMDTHLTEQERTTLAEHLRGSSAAFLAAIDGLTPAQWIFKPDAETWSIAECADHVVAVERDLLLAIQKCPEDPERGAAVQGKERLILKRVPDRSVRVKVPREIVPTGRSGSGEELAGHFRETRARTLEYVGGTGDALHARVFPHFVFQDLDGGQWLLMISLHTGRHTAQIAEVKQHTGYPQ